MFWKFWKISSIQLFVNEKYNKITEILLIIKSTTNSFLTQTILTEINSQRLQNFYQQICTAYHQHNYNSKIQYLRSLCHNRFSNINNQISVCYRNRFSNYFNLININLRVFYEFLRQSAIQTYNRNQNLFRIFHFLQT